MFEVMQLPQIDFTKFQSKYMTQEVEEVEMPPRMPNKPQTKPGDLYEFDKGHLVYCGDSTDPKKVKDKKVHLVVTSPPYNCGMEYDAYDDNMPKDQYLNLIRSVIRSSVSMLHPGCFIAWNVGVTPKTHHFNQAVILEEEGMTFIREIVWRKTGVTFPVWNFTLKSQMARKYTPTYVHEIILLFSLGKPSIGGECDVDDKYSQDVWDIFPATATKDIPGRHNPKGDIMTNHKAAMHPTPFTLEIPAGPIKHLTAKNEIIMDPFLGAGATLLAADQLGRQCIGIEIDPKYVDLVVARYAKRNPKAEILCNGKSINLAPYIELFNVPPAT